jgi:hypothetical protein
MACSPLKKPLLRSISPPSQSVSYEKEGESSIISGFKGQITECKNSQIRFLCRHVPHFQLRLFQSTADHFLVLQNVIIEMLWH